MAYVLNTVSVIFWGLLVLSLLVFIHEGGHFLSARAFGMRVTEFFLGLPSRWKLSTKSKTYGTEFGVTPILLGGYTRICGMEGVEDELLAAALMCIQRHGRVKVSELAEEIGCEEDWAYGLMATLTDWGAIRPYYDPELGEQPGQSEWPQSFETVARDYDLRCEYDRDHDFNHDGYTSDGEPRVPDMSPSEFLKHERARTYLGKSFVPRVMTLLAGPAVNIVFSLFLVIVTVSVFGMEFEQDGQTFIWRPDVITACRFAFDYAMTVARFAMRLLMPQHTMEILESSSSVVGISVMASEAASTSAVDLSLLVASVSMSLGFMNLLPIPPLDGGKIVIEIIQLVIQRPLSTKAQTIVSYVGVAFFLFIFVVALRNDIVRYILG
ncbi:MAG: site-2 protease family protein [Coriobacteriales bacterium]|nr:site-2 protease family protein [Coriobacteriales bacterium]